MREQRYDLERAIGSWRHSLELRRIFLKDDLDELEDHLRKEILRLTKDGAKPKQAFLTASESLGNQVELENAYQPVRFGKHKRSQSFLNEMLFGLSMLKHYVHISLRSFRRHAVQTCITVSGLSLALVASLVIVLYVQDELSYDRFHEDAESVHRIRSARDGDYRALMPASMAEALSTDYPDIQSVVRLFKHWEVPLISNGDMGSYEQSFYFADSSFFDVFTFELLRGNSKKALNQPNSVLLTESSARRYFGEEDPIGQTIRYKGGTDLIVTGILADIPANSHIHPDFVASMSTLPLVSYSRIMEEWAVFYTYVRTRPGVSADQLEEAIEPLRARMAGARTNFELDAQPLTSIHLRSQMSSELEANGDIRFMFMLISIGVLVLLIASINHVNIATARAMKRAREVAVRKVAGAKRAEVIQQFYVEAFVLVFVSLVVSVGIVFAFSSFLENVTGKELLLSNVSVNLLLAGLALSLVMGLMAGSYPALFLSRFQPARVLKGAFVSSRSGRRLRNLLVVAQFSASAVLIVVTLMVSKQIAHIQSVDLGFNSDNVLAIPVPGQETRSQYASMRNAWLQNSSVVSVAATASSYPGKRHSDGHTLRRLEDGPEDIHVVQRNWVDAHYFETMGISFLSGAGFHDDPSQNLRSIILNETAARTLGWSEPETATGEMVFVNPESDSLAFQIVGIVRDFNYESLHSEIGPLFFTSTHFPTIVLARVAENNLAGTVLDLQQTWKLFTDSPFTWSLLDMELESLYQADVKWGGMLRISTLFALFIACLGLLGLAAFIAETRTREIGIRKALGASSAGIVILVSKEFAVLILAAVLIAVPLSMMAVEEWLSTFAYRTELGVDVFLIGALILMATGLITVSYHAARAATAQPSVSLRSSE